MVAVSIGRSVRRSMTSASMPSPASISAASSARCTMIEVATIVTSRPSRRTTRLADRHAIGLVRHFALHLVEQLVLEDHHRIGIVDGGEQQALGVMRRGRLHHLQARHMGEPGFERLAVLGRGAGAGARRESA